MVKLIMTRGVPGSGKSHWSRQQEGFLVVEKDQIRKDLTAKGWQWSRENEKNVIAEQERLIRFYLENGNNVIAADTGFGKHERRLKTLAERCGAEFSVQDFTDVPVTTCIERNLMRPEDDRVPSKVIYEMYNKHVAPLLKPKPIVQNRNLPWVIICDLDGTLAIHDGRSPYDTAKCGTDLVNDPIAQILSTFHSQGVQIIYVSGREDRFKDETVKWIAEKCPERLNQYTELLMRKTGDFRNDAIVKNEIFDQHIRDKYYVLFVLDDRDRVVKRWRELGLTCLQVAEGAF